MNKLFIIVGLILLSSVALGFGAGDKPEDVKIADSFLTSSKGIVKGDYVWVNFFDSVKTQNKKLELFVKERKITYPKTLLEKCLVRRSEKYCLGLADKQMEIWKNNIIKQEDEILKNILKK